MKFALKSGQPAIPGSEARLPGGDRMVGNDGHLQGWDKKDLMQTISHLLKEVNAGTVETQTDSRKFADEARQRREVIVAAFNDRSGNSNSWATLGSSIAGRVQLSSDREGFMRRLLVKNDLQMGNFPRIRVTDKQVTAVIMGTNSQIMPQWVTDNYIFPPEFTIAANVRVTNKEINQGSGDILEEKYYEAQENIMVQEDLYWKTLADGTVGMDHPLKYLAGGLTPTAFSEMRTDMQRWSVPALTAVMAADFWNDIIANSAFSSWFDPLSKYEIVTTGVLGQLLGITFITDGFRHKQLKVLGTGEMYLVGDAAMHGGYTDRGPVQSNEVNNYQDGQNARGWYMFEDLSMVIANPRSVIKAKRA